MKKLNLLVLAALLCAFNVSFAQEGGMSEDEMMKKWMETCSPKAEHEMLANGAGEWDCVTKFWMGPGAEPMVSTGTCVSTMVNGGRVLSETFNGSVMGMPFEGHGMAGFDNFNKVWWSSWTDNMGTAMMYMEGTSDDGGKTITFNTTMDEPVMGVKDKPVRFKSSWKSDDVHVFESWDEVGTEHEFKAMEITYTRKK
ncbi:MAG: DUF1579 domain-containing protein [Calditrichaeota bacterium]|nr:DUF1579 domain-containing protein [Calditrichota bacterium]